jgi:hypothetical protein
MEIVLEAITIQSEWGYLEMTTGDWMCGLHNWDEALEKLASLQPIINDQGNTVKFLTAKRQSVSLQPGQPQNGC